MPSPVPPALKPAQALAILPARYASTRLPGKPLLAQTGRPLIQHVVERVRLAKRIGRVIVATDDRRIFDAVTGLGGEAMMTRADHPNGTSRLAEVVQSLGCEGNGIILNVQGDEPEIDPDVIDALVALMEDQPDLPMGTVAAPMIEPEEIQNPNVVKVVRDARERALYFSRSPIPLVRDAEHAHTPQHIHLRHLGIYAYRAGFLPTYAALPATPLEEAEKLEQLRALEHGYPIGVAITFNAHSGIDTPEQYAAFVERWKHLQSR